MRVHSPALTRLSLVRLFLNRAGLRFTRRVDYSRELRKTSVPRKFVRTGLDAARAIAMGADCVGMAGRLLGPAVRGHDALFQEIETILKELRAAMFLTGSRTVAELKKRPYILHGRTKEWVEGLG